MKRCARCGKQKPFSEFHKNSRNKDGLHSYCKECNKAKAAQHLKTEKGKAALMRAIPRKQTRGTTGMVGAQFRSSSKVQKRGG